MLDSILSTLHVLLYILAWSVLGGSFYTYSPRTRSPALALLLILLCGPFIWIAVFVYIKRKG